MRYAPPIQPLLTCYGIRIAFFFFYLVSISLLVATAPNGDDSNRWRHPLTATSQPAAALSDRVRLCLSLFLGNAYATETKDTHKKRNRIHKKIQETEKQLRKKLRQSRIVVFAVVVTHRKICTENF